MSKIEKAEEFSNIDFPPLSANTNSTGDIKVEIEETQDHYFAHRQINVTTIINFFNCRLSKKLISYNNIRIKNFSKSLKTCQRVSMLLDPLPIHSVCLKI